MRGELNKFFFFLLDAFIQAIKRKSIRLMNFEEFRGNDKICTSHRVTVEDQW